VIQEVEFDDDAEMVPVVGLIPVIDVLDVFCSVFML